MLCNTLWQAGRAMPPGGAAGPFACGRSAAGSLNESAGSFKANELANERPKVKWAPKLELKGGDGSPNHKADRPL